MIGTVLVVRLDSTGDVLITGPAVRAVAASSKRVVFLAGPAGRAAAELLPGVDDVIEWCCPWIDPDPPAVSSSHVNGLSEAVRRIKPDLALIFTSFHQSPLPLALLLRLAGVPWIGAISEDYPGSLLDLRHRIQGNVPEPERCLSLAMAAGCALPDGDDGRLALRRPLPDVSHLIGPSNFVAIHPGASVPARQWPTDRARAAVRLLVKGGHHVVVTGSASERQLTAEVAGGVAADLGGATDLPQLAAVLHAADVVIVPNTGPAHLAAAVGTPVVSLFAPVVPAVSWAPYGVPIVVLGDQQAPCRGTRARKCPIPGHPCLSDVTAGQVVDAVRSLAPASRPSQHKEMVR